MVERPTIFYMNNCKLMQQLYKEEFPPMERQKVTVGKERAVYFAVKENFTFSYYEKILCDAVYSIWVLYRYLRDSVEVLCTEYGKIGGLWFDGNWSKPDADWEEDAMYAVIRKHQPDAIIVNNTGLGSRGELGNIELDSVTFEQGRPTPLDRDGAPKYIAAEMCHTMNDHWGFGCRDFHYKSLGELIETLCACRKVGANYLLNIGPDGEGAIPEMSKALLDGLGDWIDACGNPAIYNAKPVGVTGEKSDFALGSDGKLYFFVHGLTIQGDASVTVEKNGIGWRKFDGVDGEIKSVKWVDNGEELQFEQNGKESKIYATGFPYGTNYVVRIAEAVVE